MNIMRRGVIAAMVVGSMAGGAVGATVLSAGSSSAASQSARGVRTTTGISRLAFAWYSSYPGYKRVISVHSRARSSAAVVSACTPSCRRPT